MILRPRRKGFISLKTLNLHRRNVHSTCTASAGQTLNLHKFMQDIRVAQEACDLEQPTIKAKDIATKVCLVHGP